MTRYVKILSGATRASMLNSEHGRYVRLAWADESPGEGWYPVEKVLPKPVPGPGQELGYTYEIVDGVARKTYFLSGEVRAFSKRRLYLAFKSRGLWDSVRAYMESNGLWEDWEYATTLDEDDALMRDAIAALSERLGAATMDEILAESVAD